jgi:hypothetical protein
MAAFAERQHDEALRERLERAIEGKGAFFRFREIVHGENLSEQWYAFSTGRQMGHAREFLADRGIHVGRRTGPVSADARPCRRLIPSTVEQLTRAIVRSSSGHHPFGP